MIVRFLIIDWLLLVKEDRHTILYYQLNLLLLVLNMLVILRSKIYR